jgi:hypothetical protein
VLSCPDCARYIAARTSTSASPRRHGAALHRRPSGGQWATLDLLSNGQVDFAASRMRPARIPFGVSFEDSQSIFSEGLELVRTCGRARIA